MVKWVEGQEVVGGSCFDMQIPDCWICLVCRILTCNQTTTSIITSQLLEVANHYFLAPDVETQKVK